MDLVSKTSSEDPFLDILCINLNLDDENPYIEYETDTDRVYDDINEITDEMV